MRKIVFWFVVVCLFAYALIAVLKADKADSGIPTGMVDSTTIVEDSTDSNSLADTIR